MQNLTARYNYIYNSNLLLSNHQIELTENHKENYDQILPVYLGPDLEDGQISSYLSLKPMEDIIKKAQNIILEKSNSNYLDDAYLLLGKANFFNGNYFNAAEYFDYTAKAYRRNPESYLDALNWKARSMMQLKRMAEASKVLDSLEAIMPFIKSKKRLAQPLATLAQMCINLKKDTSAISYLKDAIKAGGQHQDKIRWTYIMAQLYERQKNYTDAARYYKIVERSNAPFEMYFNANLNQIKLKVLQGTALSDNENELLAMLKDDKNLDYNDQIYFQVGENRALKGEYEEAQKFYLLAVKNTTTNGDQKGLSYLRIADLNFKQFKNYLTAKAYYDSAVNTLPKNHPGYDLVLKKTQNLQYLTNRYELIALEDTLRYISRQPEAERAGLIGALTNPVTVTARSGGSFSSSLNYPENQSVRPSKQPQQQNSFYFSNPTAVSIGFNDFKKKWGSRKLENNWRQSVRSSAQETIQDVIANTSGTPVNPDEAAPVARDKATLVKQYTEAIPSSPELLAQSDQKIIEAYYEIANFYLQELQDPKEAEETYLTILRRFPANNHLAAIYYSLYLINTGSNEARANEYRNKVLNEFPASLYAKTILDPSFSVKQSERESLINKKYNETFDQYSRKEFNHVIQLADNQAQTGTNYLSPQFAYLKAIAVGRTNAVDKFIAALDTIVKQFPDDQLITPLVREHLNYISAHIQDFKKRQIALIDFDPNEPPFSIRQVPVPTLPVTQAQVQNAAIVPAKPNTGQNIAPVPVTEPGKLAELPVPAVQTDGTFSTASSNVYYYVVDVADASLTLSSSRFGIGQFNRSTFAGSNLRHQLKEIDNEQLIYVGNFSNFDDAKAYSSGITPLLKQIMKVPASTYTSFIISKENFDKMTNKATRDKYLEFYKNNY